MPSMILSDPPGPSEGCLYVVMTLSPSKLTLEWAVASGALLIELISDSVRLQWFLLF